MRFDDIRSGHIIYILDRTDATITEEKVIDVSQPHYDAYNTSANKMVVDVTVETGAKPMIYTIPSGSEIAYVANKALATEKILLGKDLETLRAQSKQHIDDTNFHEKRIEKIDHQLAELDPSVKEKKIFETRLSTLEDSMSDVKSLLTDINNKLMTKV